MLLAVESLIKQVSIKSTLMIKVEVTFARHKSVSSYFAKFVRVAVKSFSFDELE